MAIGRVQTTQGNSTGGVLTQDITWPGNVTAGNTIVLFLSSIGSVDSVTDNLGNTYHLIQEGSTIYAGGYLAYAYNINGGSCTITVNYTGYTDAVWIAREYSGLLKTDPLDVSTEEVETGYSTTHSTGTTSATAQNEELVVIAYSGNAQANNWSATGYSNLVSQNEDGVYINIVLADKDVTTIGTQNGVFSSPGFYSMGYGAIATFKTEPPTELFLKQQNGRLILQQNGRGILI